MFPPALLLKFTPVWSFLKDHWGEIAALICGILLIWAIHHHGYVAGKDKIQMEWNQAKADEQQALMAEQMADALRANTNDIYTQALLRAAYDQANKDETDIRNEIAQNPAANSAVLSLSFVQSHNKNSVSVQ